MNKRSFDQFFNTLETTNIEPSSYYTNYETVNKHLENFRDVINNFPKEIRNQEEFINNYRNILQDNIKYIRITPLFTGVRPDKLIVLDDNGTKVKEFNEKYVTIEQAILFLKTVGFLERINDYAPFNIKSYFFGVNVGLDSHGRKNRSGNKMEKVVGSYVKKLNVAFIEQTTITKINKKWNLNLKASTKREKKYDFAIYHNKKLTLIETNFFNESGSKTDINTRFIELQKNIKKMSNDIRFIVITDGNGLKKSKKELENVFNKLDCLLNINDLKNNTLKDIILSK